MANPKAAELAAALRSLPSTDELLNTTRATQILVEAGRRRLTTLARLAIASVRKELAQAISKDSGRTETYSKETLLKRSVEQLEIEWRAVRGALMRRVINATGVVVHTNLGRAPLSIKAREAVVDAAGYCTLEYDISTGKRGKRGDHVERMLTELTGAEAALVVNNCAAAAFLVLTVLARGGEAIVSRGELVEIGGDFRIPDVLTQSGAVLREVGTTNRTKLADYENAIGENTKLVMRVHPSNYKIVGFTERPSLNELAELAHRKGLLIYEDAGSGAVGDVAALGLPDEPLIADSIAGGADVVTFSGDKLLGASQAGLIVGSRSAVERMRRHPLYRALRVDKLIYAALGATLEAYLLETAEDVPVLRMLALTEVEIEHRAMAFAQSLKDSIGNAANVDVVPGESVVGGGSAPDVRPATRLLAISHSGLSAGEIEERLRVGEPAVIARIEADQVLIDLRTVFRDEEDQLLASLVRALS